jgi:hypothetical protein
MKESSQSCIDAPLPYLLSRALSQREILSIRKWVCLNSQSTTWTCRSSTAFNKARKPCAHLPL